MHVSGESLIMMDPQLYFTTSSVQDSCLSWELMALLVISAGVKASLSSSDYRLEVSVLI